MNHPSGALVDYPARIISLLGDIQTSDIDHLVDQLLRLDAASSRDITVFVSCQGGHLLDALKIVDVIGLLRSSVTTVCFGWVEGPSVLFLARAHERIFFPGAVVSTAGIWDLPRAHAQTKPGIGLGASFSGEDGLLSHSRRRLRLAFDQSRRPTDWIFDLDLHPRLLNATECIQSGLADAIVEGPNRLLQRQHKRPRYENTRISH